MVKDLNLSLQYTLKTKLLPASDNVLFPGLWPRIGSHSIEKIICRKAPFGALLQTILADIMGKIACFGSESGLTALCVS